MKMNNLNGAESHRRLKAQTGFRDLKFINISYSEFKDVRKHFKRVQRNPNRSSRLGLTSVVLGMTAMFTNFLGRFFSDNIFIEHLSIIAMIVACVAGLCFVYQYFTFEPEENETLQEWEGEFEKHDKPETHIVDIPFNEPPRLPLNPPPNKGLRIESG